MKQSLRLVFLALFALLSAVPAFAEKLVLQVSEGNVAVWNQAINVAGNLREVYGPETQVEVVAFGQGIKMLTVDSQVATRITEAQSKLGVKFYACENSMAANKLKKADMAADLLYVRAGVEHIVTRVREGWVNIRP